MKTSAIIITFTSYEFNNLVDGDYVRLSNLGSANPLNNQKFYVGKLDSSTVILYRDAAKTQPILSTEANRIIDSSTVITWLTSSAILFKIVSTSVTNVVYADFPKNWTGYDYPVTWINSGVTVTWSNGNSTINWINHL